MSPFSPARLSDAAPAGATAAVILMHAAAARFLLDADEAGVRVLGRSLGWTCYLQTRFGLPCPTCGLTRSVTLALHGQVARAWHISPGGAAAVVGALAFSVGLLALAAMRAVGARSTDTFRSRFIAGALIAAAILLAVWLGGWAIDLAHALRNR